MKNVKRVYNNFIKKINNNDVYFYIKFTKNKDGLLAIKLKDERFNTLYKSSYLEFSDLAKVIEMIKNNTQILVDAPNYALLMIRVNFSDTLVSILDLKDNYECYMDLSDDLVGGEGFITLKYKSSKGYSVWQFWSIIEDFYKLFLNYDINFVNGLKDIKSLINLIENDKFNSEKTELKDRLLLLVEKYILKHYGENGLKQLKFEDI